MRPAVKTAGFFIAVREPLSLMLVACFMIHFHTLEIKKIQKETDDCVSISFKVPEELKNLFQFKQGQNLTIRKKINGEELRRSYSICTSPFDNELKVAVKKSEGWSVFYLRQ